MNGFTLVELLIAMTLTAVIGMVLFSTYSMVMDNGKTVRNRVLERESERVFWGHPRQRHRRVVPHRRQTFHPAPALP